MVLTHMELKKIVTDTIYERAQASSPGFLELDSFQISSIAEAVAAEVADQSEAAEQRFYREMLAEHEAGKQILEPA